MDTRKYTEKNYVTEEYLEKLNDRSFLVVDKGKEVTFKIGSRDIKGFQLVISFTETKDLKEWTMNASSMKAWQEAYGFDSDFWFQKVGKFSQQTIDGKIMWVGIPIKA